jgi:hypothetical protein
MIFLNYKNIVQNNRKYKFEKYKISRLRGISKGHNMTVLGLGGIGKAIVVMDPIPWLLHVKTVSTKMPCRRMS